MENKEKELIKLRFGLAFKQIIERNKALSLEKKTNNKEANAPIVSMRKLEAASGIRHATIVEIISGKKNAASTTIAALIDALGMNMTDFGSYYDRIGEKEVMEYKKKLEKTKKERGTKATKNKISEKERRAK